MGDGTGVDTARMQAFQRRMAETLNAGSTALMISIGHRTGLFDAMAELEPATSGQVAEAAGLEERYVREWLSAMATSKVVEYGAEDDTFRLPPEHAAFLTTAAGPANMALHMQFLPVLATVEDQVVDCFHTGGGVPYTSYDSFHAVMAEVSGARFEALLVDQILPLVPGMVDQLAAGVRVADVGTGSGRAVNVMATAFPESSFTGFDISEHALGIGRTEAGARGLTNARFEVADAATLELEDAFDFITTFDAVHDQAKPRHMVRGIHRALKRGGYWLCADIRASSDVGDNLDHPVGPFGYTVSCMHCMTVSLAYDGEGLGAMWGEQQAIDIFTEAGFADIDTRTIDLDPTNNYYVARKD